jgi:hypothetical protein
MKHYNQCYDITGHKRLGKEYPLNTQKKKDIKINKQMSFEFIMAVATCLLESNAL